MKLFFQAIFLIKKPHTREMQGFSSYTKPNDSVIQSKKINYKKKPRTWEMRG